MVYSLLYPHNFTDEDVLYKVLSTLDIEHDLLIVDMSKNRSIESLITAMAKRLGIKLSAMMNPTNISDYIIVIYDDGEYELHKNESIKC